MPKDPTQEKLLDFRKMGAIIRKNFIVLVRDKARIIPLIMFPIIMIIVFGFTSGNIPKHIPTAIVDYDNSQFSHSITDQISSNEVFSTVRFVSTEDEARGLLDSGKIKVIVIIPAGLSKKISSGQSAGITITVDESDSAVGSTAKQTIGNIISGLSKKISIERIIHFQQSVSVSSKKIESYSSNNINDYGIIISNLDAAQGSLDNARSIVSANADSMELSLTPPQMIIFPLESSNNTGAGTTYLTISPAYLSSKALIGSLRQSVVFIDSSEIGIEKSKQVAVKANDAAKASADSYKENVVIPSSRIDEFTQSDPNAMTEPLLYEEKPAYGVGKRNIDFLIPSIIALTIFQGAVMGMGRAVAGEKKNGSLTRVFLTPTSNTTIITGTLLFYSLFEIFRSTFLLIVAMTLFNIKVEGSMLTIFLIIIIYAAVSSSIGLLLSSMVKSEEQYMGVAMLVSLPSMFLAGVFIPVQSMPSIFQQIANYLPITYGADALRGVMIKGFGIASISMDLFILLLFLVVMFAGCLLVFKREIDR